MKRKWWWVLVGLLLLPAFAMSVLIGVCLEWSSDKVGKFNQWFYNALP